jgi:peptidoglycan/LPS O-acetylase OafA/YrhL
LKYFGLQADQSFLLHTWSLGIEEQFYLAFSPLLWIAAKILPRRLTAVLVPNLLGSFFLNVVAVRWRLEGTFYLLPTRAWELAAGALTPQVAMFVTRWRILASWMASAGLGLLG